MIKFSHSVFALPFAFTSAFFAANGMPSVDRIVWITVAMVGARSSAMGMNRIIDRDIDAKNPRTSKREIPSGAIRVADAVVFVVVSLAVFVYAAYRLNPLCLKLSPLAVAILFSYSYAKRFTYLSHVVLGIAIAGAPLGAWIAVRGGFDMEILPLAGAVVFWLAGFDILYALQDVDFDGRQGLYSIPRRFGVKNALRLSRIFHAITWVLLGMTGYVFKAGAVFFTGVIFVGFLFIREHSLVSEDDLSGLDMAFFNMNGYISITVCIAAFIDLVFV